MTAASSCFVSLIICCYESADTLAAQLDAIVGQRIDRPWEVICVYQPSADATRAILDRYEREVPHLRVVEATERLNVGYARNVGVAAARGGELLFCDADDVMRPGWVAAMSSALQKDTLVGGILDTHSLNTPAVASSRGEIPPIQQWPGFLPHVAAAAMGIRRECFERIGGFHELSSREDADLAFRAQLDGGATVGIAAGAILEYRYRTRFWEIVSQGRSYARGDILLRERYERRGMPRLGLVPLLRGWAALVAYLPQVLRADTRLEYAWRLGYGFGFLETIIGRRYRPQIRS